MSPKGFAQFGLHLKEQVAELLLKFLIIVVFLIIKDLLVSVEFKHIHIGFMTLTYFKIGYMFAVPEIHMREHIQFLK
jgi:hypothetical protein